MSCRTITINHTKVPNTNQANFPVLITGTYSDLATTANGGSVTNANGYDIIFTSDPAGLNILAFEQESYSASTGTINYWVKIPTLSATVDTVIFMFYGNSSITTDQSNKNAVWDANFMGVWHFNQTPNGASSILDSTSNGFHGTPAATGITLSTDGIAGGSLQFAGNSPNSYVTLSSSLPGTQPLTVGVWIKTTGLNSTDQSNIITKSTWSSTGWSMGDDGQYDSNIYFRTMPNWTSLVDIPRSSVNNGAWHYFTGTLDSSSNLRFYLDGSLSGSSSPGSISADTSDIVYVGGFNGNAAGGLLSEVRISNAARSPDWIATEYNNAISPSTFSTPGTAAGGTSTAPTITNLSLTYGSSISVTISGTNFGSNQSSSTVALGGLLVTPSSWSATSLVATVPYGVGNNSAPVVVTVGGTPSNAVAFTPQLQSLPTPWLDQDIGSVGTAGSAGFLGGTFTITGSGSTIGNYADSMHFAYQTLSGDGTITARIASRQGGSTNQVAAVMMRETLNAGATDAYVNCSNTGVTQLSVRPSTGAYGQSVSTIFDAMPCWVRLVRSGNVFTGFGSVDGVNWTQIASQTVSMASSAYAGLAMSSVNNPLLATDTFDNVSISTPSTPAAVITAVSATTGSFGTPVTISGTGFGTSQGNSLVTLNGPAITVNSWSATSISITIPVGATSGPLMVVIAPSMNDSNSVMFTVESNSLPSPWLDDDIGNVGVTGSASYSSGTFTVIGSGGIGGTADSTHFAYQPLSGDGSLIARIVSEQGGDPTWERSGIMLRETLNPGSTMATVLFYNGSANFVVRSSTGTSAVSAGGLAISLPCYVQLVRIGNVISAYASANGLNWTQLGSSQTITMASTIYSGLPTSSETNNLATAVLDTVSSVPGRSSPTAPAISSLSPVLGGFGTSVTINGVDFGATQGTSVLQFNGTTVTSITSWSNTQIVALVPTGATTGQVGVTVSSVPSLSNPSFKIYNPVITSFTPPAAQAGATITINGSGFMGNANNIPISFNGAGNAASNWTDTSITITVPPNATSGPVNATVGGITSNSVQFTVLEPLAVTSISPASAPAGASVTITGAGFGATQSTSTLGFYGTTATSITSWSDTQIVALVPTGAMSGQVYVTLAGQSMYGPSFTQTTTAIVTDSLGDSSTYTAALIGGQWNLTNADGSGCSTCTTRGVIQNAFDGNGNMLTSTDELGNTTTQTYDVNNNVLSTAKPLNSSTAATNSYTYNSFGEVLTATDPLGNVTTNTYDANGNLLTVTSPAPASGVAASVTHFAYNSLGELTQITDPLGHVSTMTYTAAGLIATITDAQSNVTTYAYDAHGNRTSVTDALGNVTTFAYDAGDRLITITHPPAQSGGSSTTSSFTYDSRGRRTSVTDQNGKTTSYAYDTADRLTAVTDAASNVTTYSYDTENNLLGITDANSHTTNFTYDAFGRVTQTTFPSSFYESYAYDAIGNLTSKTDRKGQTIQYVYDALNRLTQKSYPDSTSAAYTYDLASRIQQVNDPTGTYAFAYDNMGRLIGTTTNYSFLSGTTFTNAYTYDAASDRTGYTAPDGSTNTYAYDTLNRLTTLANSWAGSFNFTYDSLSRRTQMTRPNGVNTHYSYDSLSRLLGVLHQTGASTIDGASYTVDAAGNRTSKTDQMAGVTSNYAYDALYELTQVTQAANTTESYTYDPVANRLSSLAATTSSYNSSNQLTSNSNATFTYDANGNTTSKTDSIGTTNYTWDFENRLTSVVLPGNGGTVSFKYDPMGRRIEKTSSSTTSIYAYDGNDIAETTDGGGNIFARYTQGQGIDEPLALQQGGATSYYHADGLGSITSLSNTSGTLAQTYAFDSFGKATASSGSLNNPFQYTGREFDNETNLYFYRARYYNPATGWFLNEDPSAFEAGMNFYAYVANNPVNWIDPLGLDRLSFDNIANLVAKNNRSGQSNELIICMAYKESTFDPDASLPGSQSARGLLGVTDTAATDAGFDWDTLGDPATNIMAGSTYLGIRIHRNHGNVRNGLIGYGTGGRYADSLLKCETCLIKNADEKSDCKTKDCLAPLHPAPTPKPRPRPKPRNPKGPTP